MLLEQEMAMRRRVKPWLAVGLLIAATNCQQISSGESRSSAMASSGAVEQKPSAAKSRATRARGKGSWFSGDEAVTHFVPAGPNAEVRWVDVSLGDGWGCALRQDRSYECWAAAARAGSGTDLVARSIPWLDGKRIFVGPDRICTREGTRLRCWRAPEFIQAREPSVAPATSAVQSWVIPIEPSVDGVPVQDPTPVTHGVKAGCAAGFCWGVASAFASTFSCQFGSVWLPCSVVDDDEPTLHEFARSDGLNDIVLGLSERPSACGTDEQRRLSCWGEGYSRDVAGAIPVRVQPGPAHPFVAWDAPGRFHQSCAIRNDCGRSVHALETCAPGSKSLSATELLALADGFEGARVSVRGNLMLIPVAWRNLSGIMCGPFTTYGKPLPIVERGGGMGAFCCPAEGDAPVVVTNGQRNLIVEGSWCFGDSSRTCCSLPVFGQAVIVSGVFAWREVSPQWSEGWVLQQPELCLPDQ